MRIQTIAPAIFMLLIIHSWSQDGLVDKVDKLKDVPKRVSKLEALSVSDKSGRRLSIFTGIVTNRIPEEAKPDIGPYSKMPVNPALNTWYYYQKDTKNNAMARIDTSDAGFTEAPTYFFSTTKGASWLILGVGSIYNAKPDSFDIYLSLKAAGADYDILHPKIMGGENVEIHWMGVGVREFE